MATWRKYFNSSNSGLPVNVTGQNSDGYSTTILGIAVGYPSLCWFQIG